MKPQTPKKPHYRAVFITALIIGLCIGHGSGTLVERMEMQSVAISQQLAHFDPRTGDFAWGPIDAGIVLQDKIPADIFVEPKKGGKK